MSIQVSVGISEIEGFWLGMWDLLGRCDVEVEGVRLGARVRFGVGLAVIVGELVGVLVGIGVGGQFIPKVFDIS